MSSDDSDSDFDKEAEREKLREKYERDKKDRENTQRMSELLLQGATMTGKHCGECGDPIFRYDGQEFCPTCQREVEGGTNEGGEADETEPSATDAERAGQSARADDSPGAEAAATSDGSDGEPRVEIDDVRVADRHVERDRRSPPSQGDRGDADQGTAGRENGAPDSAGRRRPPSRAGTETPHERDAAPNYDVASRSPAASPGDLGAARSSLVRTLNDLARRAEETDDVSRTRELLAASREAAEALAALDRTDRR